jgi:cytochrome c553
MSRILLSAALAAAFTLAANPALAQEKKRAQPQKSVKKAEPTPEQAAAGKKEAANVAMCIGCHGIPGYKTAFPEVYHVPKIAGQQPAYIVAALKAYKSGERSHPSMRGIAASLSEQDMADLAAYYGEPAK